jgi:branched-chain amino acid transport system substrate-binding protein
MKSKALALTLLFFASACRPGSTTVSSVPTFFLVLPTPTQTATIVPTTVWLTAAPLAASSLIPTTTPTPHWPVATLDIVSSLPMTGLYASTTGSTVKAEKLRLQQADYLACKGKYQLAFDALDNSENRSGGSNAELETANAQSAIDAPSVIAYLGAFTSDDAKLIIPMLNQAGPLVIISPFSTYPGLTKPVNGIPAEPDQYYPTGIRNFARVVTTDDVQGAVSAEFMSQVLGVKSVFILDDEELYGQTVSDVFEAHARILGIQVLGHEAIPRVQGAERHEPLLLRILTSDVGHAPDAIFASTVVNNSAIRLLQEKVDLLGDNSKVKFMGPAGIYTQSFIDSAGNGNAEGVYAAAPGLPYPASLPAAGTQFIKDYEGAYTDMPDPAAIYGYESMNVLLQAIENLCASGGDPTDRRQVRDAVFAVHDFSGALGTWSFDQNGDTTLRGMTIYQVKGGAWEMVNTYK